jgi:hypothetical protein
VRKHLRYGHIPHCPADSLNACRRCELSPDVNFRRLRSFAETITDPLLPQVLIFPTGGSEDGPSDAPEPKDPRGSVPSKPICTARPQIDRYDLSQAKMLTGSHPEPKARRRTYNFVSKASDFS